MKPRRSMHQGSIASHVMRCLAELEPCTSTRIAEELELDVCVVSRVLGYNRGDRCHVALWKRGRGPDSVRARAVYVTGPGRDAKKPPRLTPKIVQRRMRACKRVMVNSVFALGSPIHGRVSFARIAGLS